MVEIFDASKFKLKRQLAREAIKRWERIRNAETTYSRQLRKIARHIGDIIKGFPIGDEKLLFQLLAALTRYAEVLRPWAQAQAQKMILEVSKREEAAWFQVSKEIGQELRTVIKETPIGTEVRKILEDQVHLITSLPIDAGRRIQLFTQEYVAGGRRYEELVSLVLASGQVTVARANLIARTEVAKASSALTQARAKYVGSTHYVWHSVRDIDVRRMHKKLDGTIQAWNDPPIAEAGGQRHHPGDFPNCRCWAQPILPEATII